MIKSWISEATEMKREKESVGRREREGGEEEGKEEAEERGGGKRVWCEVNSLFYFNSIISFIVSSLIHSFHSFIHFI